jgi:hypothetical protein
MNNYSVNPATNANAERLYDILESRYGLQDVTICIDDTPKSVTYLTGYGAYVCSGVTTDEDQWLMESEDVDLADAIRTQGRLWRQYYAEN